MDRNSALQQNSLLLTRSSTRLIMEISVTFRNTNSPIKASRILIQTETTWQQDRSSMATEIESTVTKTRLPTNRKSTRRNSTGWSTIKLNSKPTGLQKFMVNWSSVLWVNSAS